MLHAKHGLNAYETELPVFSCVPPVSSEPPALHPGTAPPQDLQCHARDPPGKGSRMAPRGFLNKGSSHLLREKHLSVNHNCLRISFTGLLFIRLISRCHLVMNTFHVLHGGSRDWSLWWAESLHYCLHAVICKGGLPVVFFNYPITNISITVKDCTEWLCVNSQTCMSSTCLYHKGCVRLYK